MVKQVYPIRLSRWTFRAVLAAIAVSLVSIRPTDAQQSVVAVPGSAADKRATDESHWKLRFIGRALSAYHQAMQGLPPPQDHRGNFDGAGLSWRVHLLPFVGEPELYEAFRFDEAWDSPHNKTLLARMPAVYRLGNQESTTTRFRVFGGEKFLFGSKSGLRNATDGRTHTVLALIVGSNQATPWTKPDTLLLDPDAPRSQLGLTTEEPIECVMADGRLLTIPPQTEPAVITALITPMGGEIVDADAIRASSSPTNRPASESPVIETAPGMPIKEQLARIVAAMTDYYDVYRSFPVRSDRMHFDERGQPKLSWRVHLLPFLEQEALYRRFHLDEAWDSPNNKALLRFIPTVYDDGQETNTTRIATIQGERALFGKPNPPSRQDIRDGSSNTILIAQVGLDQATPWTKPDEIYFDPARPMECLGELGEGEFSVALADGTILRLRNTIPPATFSALVTPDGGEVIDFRELQRSILR